MSTSFADVAYPSVPVVIGVLFLFSAARKLSAPASVTKMVVNLGIHQRLANVAASGLISAELISGLVAFYPMWHVLAGALTVALGTSFGLAGLHAAVNRSRVQCACFGGAGRPLGLHQTAWMPAFWLVGLIQIATTAQWTNADGVMVTAASITVIAMGMAVAAIQSTRVGSGHRIATSQTTSIHA